MILLLNLCNQFEYGVSRKHTIIISNVVQYQDFAKIPIIPKSNYNTMRKKIKNNLKNNTPVTARSHRIGLMLT